MNRISALTGFSLYQLVEVFLLIAATALCSAGIGYNTLLFPVHLEQLSFGEPVIGLILSCELVSVLAVALKVNHILGQFGLFKTILFASLVRSFAVFALSLSSNILFWCLSVICLGISTYLVLISLQTWINCLDLGHLRGLIVGLYSSALSLGTALGPIAAGSIGVDGTSVPFAVSSTLVLSVILIVLPLVSAVPRFRADSVPRIFYAIRMAKVPMLSSLVGGITFYGLPAFLALYGMMNGFGLFQASTLLMSFMLGSVFIGPLVSSLAEVFNRQILNIMCVLVGVLCAIYLPLAIYSYAFSLGLLFVWGGSAGGIYAASLASVGDLFRQEDQISANVAYSVLDNVGGTTGVFVIGLLLGLGIKDAITFVVTLAALSYYVFILSDAIRD